MGSIRPNSSVRVGSRSGKVAYVSKRKQGGAWVPKVQVKFEDNRAVRRVRHTNVNTKSSS